MVSFDLCLRPFSASRSVSCARRLLSKPERPYGSGAAEGFQQCYNAQTVVEGENQLVVATTVTDNASDQGQLIPMVDAVADTCGEMPRQVLADASYCNERDLKRLEARDIDGYVSLAREGKAGVNADPDKHPAKARMAGKLASDEGRIRYARRKWMAEAPVGWIKEGFPSMEGCMRWRTWSIRKASERPQVLEDQQAAQRTGRREVPFCNGGGWQIQEDVVLPRSRPRFWSDR